MLKKLIRKFRKNTQDNTLKEEKVKAEELSGWIKQKKENIESKARKDIEEICLSINKEIEITKQNSENLKNAKLKNKDIPKKEIHFMEGNREAYLRRVKQFISNIKLSEFSEDIRKASGIVERFDEDLMSFGRSTFRQYSILQHFFAYETNKIAENIKHIDGLMKKVKKVLSDLKIEEIRKLEADISHMSNRKKQREETLREIESCKKKINKKMQKLDSYRNELNILNSSESYKRVEDIKKETETVSKQISLIEYSLREKFSVLDRALRKYQKISYENGSLIESYLKGPLSALADDNDLKIITILRNVKKLIENRTLKLKDKKSEKTIAIIDSLTKDYLTSTASGYCKMIRKKEELEEKLKNSSALKKKEELNKKIVSIKQDIKAIERALKDNKTKIEDSSTETMIKRIESRAESLFGVKITVEGTV